MSFERKSIMWHQMLELINQGSNVKVLAMTARLESGQDSEKKERRSPYRAPGLILGSVLALLPIYPATAASTPTAPVSVIAQRTYTDVDEISWSDASTNESFFTVDYRPAGGSTWSQLRTVSSTSTIAMGKRYATSLHGLPTQYHFCYRVAAVNGAGKTYSPQVCAGYRPSNPKNLRLSLNWYSALLTFERSAYSESKYRLYYQVNGAGQWFAKVYDAPTYTSTDIRIEWYGTLPNTNYCFYVVAFNDLGNSSPTNTVCGNTGPFYEP